MYIGCYLSGYFCYSLEKVIFMESVSYDLLCLKSKMSNKSGRKTYVLLNSGLLSEKTLTEMLQNGNMTVDIDYHIVCHVLHQFYFS